MTKLQYEPTGDGRTIAFSMLTHSLKKRKIVHATYWDGCAYCEREKANGCTFFPPHNASARCRSGRRAHCTCDTCF